MLRVMLVDDEPIIKAAFQKMIPWEREGFRIAGMASNGLEALQLLDKCPVDIIITDLKMPQMDGIALIKALKARGFDGIILVLSNYADFELVREALVAGAKDYMLKVNIDADTLLGQLCSAREHLSTLRRNAQQEQLIAEHGAVLRAYTLQTCLATDTIMPDPPQALLEAYAPARGPFEVCDILFMPSSQRNPAHMPSATHVESVLRAIFEDVPEIDIMVLGEREILCVYATHALTEKGIRSADKHEQILRQISMYFNTSALLLIAKPVSSLWEIFAAREACGRAAALAFYALPAMACEPVAVQFGNIPENFEVETIARQLAEGMLASQHDHAQVVLTEFFAACRNARTQPSLVRAFCGDTIRRLASYAPFDVQAPSFADAIAGLESCADEWMLLAEMVALSQQILPHIIPPSFAGCKPDIRRALLFIHTHYDTQITLDDIANAANLDRSYLCRLFKREMGVNPFAYLNELRMNAAAQMIIRDEGVYVREVASRVGISDPFYFARLFKKQFGLSPSEYRMSADAQ